MLFLIVDNSIVSLDFAMSQDAPTPNTKQEQKKAREALAKQIENREEQGNGIFIIAPEVYDDSSLQQMLNAAQAKLASLQGLDQASLTSHLGAITGSTFQQSLFSAQVSGGPNVPQSVVTAAGPTSTVAATVGGTSPGTTTTTTAPTQSSVTSPPASTSPIPSAPTDTGYTLPSTFSGSASDLLNEQMQLTYEIANLQLLLEGSLSDRFVQGQRIVKRRTTLGFSVNFSQGKRYKNALAVVEVEVQRPNELNRLSEEPPSITALLPREKTYNVAAIKDRMTSLGAGVVTSVVSGGASWTGGRKTFYIVQDQDTVALMQPATDPKKDTAFSWQFRPVLGESFVRTGMRQTFVQIAVPAKNAASCMGKVHLRTYWRKYDEKNGIVKDVIADSIRDQDVWPIPVYDLSPKVDTLSYDDVGGGQVQVELGGHFLSGTYIRIGSSYYRNGTPGFTSETSQIRFIAPAVDIAVHKAYIVSRDGTEVEILDPQDPEYLPPLATDCDVAPAVPSNPDQDFHRTETTGAKVQSFDDSNVLLNVEGTITFPKQFAGPEVKSYYLLVGNRLFGLRDAPFERTLAANSVHYRIVVPADTLASAREVTLLPLFWKREKFALTAALPDSTLASVGEKLVLIQQNDKQSSFVLYGNRLKDAKVLVPSGATLQAVDHLTDDGTIRTIDLSADQLKTVKQLVLQKSSDERPTFVAIPTTDAKTPAKPTLTPQGRITVGADRVVVTGDGLDKLKAVRFEKKSIKFSVSGDKKSVTLSGLAAAGATTAPTTQELEFEFESGPKSTVKIDIVNARVETVDGAKN